MHPRVVVVNVKPRTFDRGQNIPDVDRDSRDVAMRDDQTPSESVVLNSRRVLFALNRFYKRMALPAAL
jgi:hypothetical protein